MSTAVALVHHSHHRAGAACCGVYVAPSNQPGWILMGGAWMRGLAEIVFTTITYARGAAHRTAPTDARNPLAATLVMGAPGDRRWGSVRLEKGCTPMVRRPPNRLLLRDRRRALAEGRVKRN